MTEAEIRAELERLEPGSRVSSMKVDEVRYAKAGVAGKIYSRHLLRDPNGVVSGLGAERFLTDVIVPRHEARAALRASLAASPAVVAGRSGTRQGEA